ncbi:hypothetical protein M9458_050827, partial [Cirrhinus mrigala]
VLRGHGDRKVRSARNRHIRHVAVPRDGTRSPAPASGQQAEKAPRDREPPVKFPLNKLHVGCWVRRGHEGRRAPRFVTGDRRGPPNRAREFRGPRRFLGRSGTGT